MRTLILGIDPDVDLNGIAIYSRINNVRSLELKNLKFFDLMEFLQENKDEIKIVIVEAGWLNKKSNFRFKKGNNVHARIGKNVGSNHEAGRKIAEMLVHLDINYALVKPLKKNWKGKDGKITHEEFVKLTKMDFKRTNQEQRDSALLVWGY